MSPIPQIVRANDVSGLGRKLRGGVVAIGNFDGVHRGHQAVLAQALALAGAANVPALVLTFEPHPRTVFRPEEPVFRLTPAPVKAHLLAALGFDGVVEYPFTRDFAALEPEDFVRRILVEGLGISHVVTGFDFHFGRNRAGGPAYLMDAGKHHGFDVTLIDAFRDEGNEIVSSSRIRACIGQGDVAAAAGLLGYRFTLEAEVVHGEKLGRTLGFPTANMLLPDETELAYGIYAVRFRTADGVVRDGVASYGRRPTVNEDGTPLLETYVFDFGDDLYGKMCAVSLFAFLRGEEKFDGLDALVQQMERDEASARAILSEARPLSDLDAIMAFEA